MKYRLQRVLFTDEVTLPEGALVVSATQDFNVSLHKNTTTVCFLAPVTEGDGGQ